MGYTLGVRVFSVLADETEWHGVAPLRSMPRRHGWKALAGPALVGLGRE